MIEPGQEIGPYTVVAALGAGGMGEVYRVRDSRLDRDAAIKVLPHAFSADPGRVARFEQEAKAIAALSHPNVLAIFDTGWADTAQPGDRHLYVVTELLEGETLRARLDSGALPVRKAIDVAVQIARGLAAAHDKGLVHRDIKPENVFVTSDGHVKILDFGLARLMREPDTAGVSVTRPVMTDAGTVLGTVGYMAPEQVRAQPADARADLFSLGAVLYEMLTGQRAFRRDTAAETMTAILKEEPPDVAAARPDIPPALERIVQHCLEKNPNERFQSARDVAFALESLSGSNISTAAAEGTPGRSRAAVERLAWAAITVALAVAIIWMQLRRPAVPDAFAAPHRMTIVLPEGVTLPNVGPPPTRFAISPDGAHLAFVGMTDRGSLLWVQSLNDTAGRAIEGSDDASLPFWSPDSRFLAFRRNDRLMQLEVAGSGRVTEIGAIDGAGVWATGPPGEDWILSWNTRAQRPGIRLLSRRTSEIKELFDAGPSDFYLFPSPLYDGRHFLFTYTKADEGSPAGLFVGTFGSTDKRQILALDANIDQPNAYYASGYLLLARNQAITARPFDRKTMTAGSEVSDIAGPILAPERGGAAFSVSQNGVLVYQPAPGTDRYQLVVHDRNGQVLRTLSDEAGYSNVELSPDGSQLAVSVPDPATRTRDIWIIDMVRGVRSRVTFDPSDERSMVWSDGGKALVYTSKGLDLYTKTLGMGAETPFLKDGVSKDPRGWSPDGQSFVYRASGPETRNDLWIKPRDPNKPPYALLATPFDENYPVFAPDGRWLAYVSNESGRYEVYATSFPSGQGKWQISTDGGTYPRWRRDGKEIVYLAADDKLMSVVVDGTGPALRVSPPEALFQTRAAPGPGAVFDMTADAQRFIVNTLLPSSAPPSLVVLYNWPALIGER